MKKYFSSFAAIILAAICYPLAKAPSLNSREMSGLAARFSFKRFPLAEVPNHPPYKFVRQVHPSLERISAWVSSLGAAATLADLDGDGLPNDVCYVDPRTDLVTIAPVPGTGSRYQPFTLNPEPLPHDSTLFAWVARMFSATVHRTRTKWLDFQFTLSLPSALCHRKQRSEDHRL